MEKEFTVIAKVTVDANAPANSTFPVKFLVDPRQGELNAIQIPKGETWVLKDVYVTSAPSVDAIVEIYKNDDNKVLGTDPLSALVQRNSAKPKYKPVAFEEFSKLSAVAITLAANGTSAAEITFYMKFEKVPVTQVQENAPVYSPAPARPSIKRAFEAIVP